MGSDGWRHPALTRSTAFKLADRAGLAMLLGVGLALGLGFAMTGFRPVDTDLYWRTAQSADYYGAVWGVDDAFYVYPPPLAQIVGLLTPLGWETFVVGWTAFTFVGLWAMTRALAIPTLVVGGASAFILGVGNPLAEPLVIATIGNIGIWLLAAIVVAPRWPSTWAVAALTKMAPSIGLLWFPVRREWRQLALAVTTIGAVAAISVVAAPEQWAAFLTFAMDNVAATSPNPVVPIPWPVRVAMSIVVIVWAARTDRYWIVPFAAGWASFVLYHQGWVSMLLASLALYVWTYGTRPDQPTVPSRATSLSATAAGPDR